MAGRHNQRNIAGNKKNRWRRTSVRFAECCDDEAGNTLRVQSLGVAAVYTSCATHTHSRTVDKKNPGKVHAARRHVTTNMSRDYHVMQVRVDEGFGLGVRQGVWGTEVSQWRSLVKSVHGVRGTKYPCSWGSLSSWCTARKKRVINSVTQHYGRRCYRVVGGERGSSEPNEPSLGPPLCWWTSFNPSQCSVTV